MKRIWTIAIVLLLGFGSSVKAVNQAVLFTPEERIIAGIGQSFGMKLALDSGVVGAHAYRVTFAFDTTVIRLDSIVMSPEWRAVTGLTPPFFYYQDSTDVDSLGTPVWYIDLFSAFLGSQYQINGYVDVATIWFHSAQPGISPLQFRQFVVQNSLLQFVANSSKNALILVCPLPPGYVYFGDLDRTGNIDIGDLTFMINFLFLLGPEPQPIILAADVTCDDGVDIGDLTALIDHLFISFSPLCNHCP